MEHIFVNELQEGTRVAGIYLCKEAHGMTTKAGKPYVKMVFEDKTGTVDVMYWDVSLPDLGLEDGTYVYAEGDISVYNEKMQFTVKDFRKAEDAEYDIRDYIKMSKYDIEAMYQSLLNKVDMVENPYMHQLLDHFFRDDPEMVARMKLAPAAKTIHHGFGAGLLQHTVYVATVCVNLCKCYRYLNKDLLLTAALLHDIGKVRELTDLPGTTYTNEGNLLGHIYMGAEMVHDAAMRIEGFPENAETDIKHCILAHHGELEFGSPKRPELAEAVALNMADNIDAKMEATLEVLERTEGPDDEWLGYQSSLEAHLRRTPKAY